MKLELTRADLVQIVRDEVRRMFDEEMDDHVREVTINTLKQCGLEGMLRHVSGHDKAN